MRILIEGFAYCIMMALIFFITIEMFVSHNSTVIAQNYYSYIKQTAVADWFDPETLENLKKEAESKGYEISFTDTTISDCYWVELKYNIQMNLIGVNSPDTIKSYVKAI